MFTPLKKKFLVDILKISHNDELVGLEDIQSSRKSERVMTKMKQDIGNSQSEVILMKFKKR